MDDLELLREYVEKKSETAFAGLVKRHVDMVYSTAVRMVRDETLAQDIAQCVFIKLAKKAGTIRAGNALPGWLYRTTRSQAANAIRADQARRQRETEAMNMAELDAQPAHAWNAIASGLDEAISTLNEAEQNAVVLRFFEGQSWREVSQALSLSEDTAQRLVNRGLQNLRDHFARQGIVLPASVIGVTIAAHAVQAAPATLGAGLTAASLAASGLNGAGVVSTLIETVASKATLATATAILTGTVIVGLSVAFVRHHSNPVNAETMRRGLVLHLGFDQEEPDGRTSDDSGLGNHGQVTGAKWTASGRRGGAHEFKSDGDRIEVSNSPSLNPAAVTISAWINCPRPGAAWQYILEMSAPTGPVCDLSVLGDGHHYSVRGQVHSQIAQESCQTAKTMVADGQWHLLTVTFDGRRQCLYVDGRLEGNSRRRRQNISNDLNLTIGRKRSHLPRGETPDPFHGLIDEVRVYNRVLSGREVKFLFASAEL